MYTYTIYIIMFIITVIIIACREAGWGAAFGRPGDAPSKRTNNNNNNNNSNQTNNSNNNNNIIMMLIIIIIIMISLFVG